MCLFGHFPFWSEEAYNVSAREVVITTKPCLSFRAGKAVIGRLLYLILSSFGANVVYPFDRAHLHLGALFLIWKLISLSSKLLSAEVHMR